MVIERAHRVKKCDKSKQGALTIVAKLLNYKEKEYILKNTRHLKGTNIFVYEDFSRETIVIRHYA